MSNTPSEKGIVDAMKSMKNITDRNSKSPSPFPLPPKDLGGTPPPLPKKKAATKAPKKTASKTEQAPNSPPTPIPPPQPDVNAQLFGTLLNSLKTCPPDQKVPGGMKKTKTKKNKGKVEQSRDVKKKPSYESSSSYASSSSASSSDSSSCTSSSVSSSRSSLPSSAASYLSSEPSSRGKKKKAGKISIEKKKRGEELLHEKIEMLTRIKNLSKNGFIASKEWDVSDDIDEVRYECYRMQRESNAKKSIKIMRRVLVTITTLVETGNAYFNPFNLRLGGFSESMMLSLDDYDDCFEQIHHKYSGRSSVGPEMQILFTFLSAAIFHHAGNSIGGGRGRGETGKKKPSASPMSSVMSMMGMINQSKPSFTSPAPPPTTEPDGAADSASAKPKRKTMRGPGASSIPTSILGGINNRKTTPSMTVPT